MKHRFNVSHHCDGLLSESHEDSQKISGQVRLWKYRRLMRYRSSSQSSRKQFSYCWAYSREKLEDVEDTTCRLLGLCNCLLTMRIPCQSDIAFPRCISHTDHYRVTIASLGRVDMFLRHRCCKGNQVIDS